MGGGGFHPAAFLWDLPPSDRGNQCSECNNGFNDYFRFFFGGKFLLYFILTHLSNCLFLFTNCISNLVRLFLNFFPFLLKKTALLLCFLKNTNAKTILQDEKRASPVLPKARGRYRNAKHLGDRAERRSRRSRLLRSSPFMKNAHTQVWAFFIAEYSITGSQKRIFEDWKTGCL